MKNYNEKKVCIELLKKNDIYINSNYEIQIISNNNLKNKKNDIGNKSWGKIDFLKNYCDYKVNFVYEFNKENR